MNIEKFSHFECNKQHYYALQEWNEETGLSILLTDCINYWTCKSKILIKKL